MKYGCKAMPEDLTLDDFRKQLELMSQHGLQGLVERWLGLDLMVPREEADRYLRCVGRMIDAMTPEERHDPACIDVQRRLRIALHSDTQPHEVQQFLRQFDHIRGLTRQMVGLSFWERIRLLTGFRGFSSLSDDDPEE